MKKGKSICFHSAERSQFLEHETLFIDVNISNGDKHGILTAFRDALNAPDYFGMNWDALKDILTSAGDSYKYLEINIRFRKWGAEFEIVREICLEAGGINLQHGTSMRFNFIQIASNELT